MFRLYFYPLIFAFQENGPFTRAGKKSRELRQRQTRRENYAAEMLSMRQHEEKIMQPDHLKRPGRSHVGYVLDPDFYPESCNSTSGGSSSGENDPDFNAWPDSPQEVALIEQKAAAPLMNVGDGVAAVPAVDPVVRYAINRRKTGKNIYALKAEAFKRYEKKKLIMHLKPSVQAAKKWNIRRFQLLDKTVHIYNELDDAWFKGSVIGNDEGLTGQQFQKICVEGDVLVYLDLLFEINCWCLEEDSPFYDSLKDLMDCVICSSHV